MPILGTEISPSSTLIPDPIFTRPNFVLLAKSFSSSASSISSFKTYEANESAVTSFEICLGDIP